MRRTDEAKERALKRSREWKARNAERVREMRKRYYKEHKDSEAAHHRAWVARNPARMDAYAMAHAQYVRDWQARQKAERTGLDAMFDPSQVRQDYGNACWACGSSERTGIDHVVPLSRGGTNFAFNVRLLCQACNAKKSARLDHEVADMQFRLRLLMGSEAYGVAFPSPTNQCAKEALAR